MITGNNSEGFQAFEKDRIKNYSEKTGKILTDLHVNPHGDLCVAPKNMQYFVLNSKNKNNFINNLLLPFLYSHSFFEKYGERPWLDYSHGEIGYLEAYVRESVPDSKDKIIRTIHILKDCGVTIKKLEDQDFIEELRLVSDESVEGAQKLVEDIERFALRRFLRN